MKRVLFSICLLIMACLIDGNSSLVSAQETDSLTVVNHLGGEADAVFVSGSYAYVGFGPELTVLDISNPAQPVRIGYLLLPDKVRDIQVANEYAYVVTEQAGLHLVDVSTPTTPTLISTFTLPGEGREVVIANHHAYLEAIRRYNGQEFVGGGVYVIDISQPTAPTQIAFYPSVEDESHFVSIVPTSSPDKAYIADGGWKNGPAVVDVSNPTAPVELVLTDGISKYGSAKFLADHLAYVRSSQGLHITDLSDPSAPNQLGLFSHWGSIVKTTIINDMAYLIVGELSIVSGNVWLVDVSNSTRPTLTGSYSISSEAHDIAVADDYLYVAAGPLGLRVVDISSPTAPVEIATYLPPVAIYNITPTANNTAYAYTQTGSQWGLQQIDLTDPIHPAPIKFHPVDSLADIATPLIDTEFLHLVRHISYDEIFFENQLQILNWSSQPPVEIARYSLPGLGWTIKGQITDDYAYLPTGDLGLHILDISNPAMPQAVGSYFNPALPQDASFQEEMFGNYTIKIARSQAALEDTLLVYKDDQLIYTQPSSRYLGIAGANQYKDPEASLGQDVTGNGIPNMVIEVYTGGAHCCSLTYIFELGDIFRLVAIIPTTHSSGDFTHLDDDNIPEFVFHDWHFAYWVTSFVGSPSPQMILHYQDEVYRPAIDLLRQPAPSWATLAEQAQGIQLSFSETGIFPELLATMLNLIYSGHADLAWKFLDTAWPSEFAGKDEFLTAFLHKLSTNIYWPELQMLNAGQWPAPFDAPAGESRLEPFSHTPTKNISVAEDDNLAGPVNVVAVQDGYAYVGFGTGLMVLDIADPTLPHKVDYLPLHYPLADIVAAGSYLYLAEKSDPLKADDSAYLRVVDITNPATPVEVGSYEIAEGNTSQLTLREHYVGLIARRGWGKLDQLEILDMSTPETPVQVAAYPLPQGVGRATLAGWIGDYIYVTLEEGGVFVLQFTPAS